MTTEYTPEQMAEAVFRNADNGNIDTMNGWLEQGDSIAIYENHDLGHPLLGHKIFLSFGSPEAQIEGDTLPGPSARSTSVVWASCTGGTS